MPAAAAFASSSRAIADAQVFIGGANAPKANKKASAAAKATLRGVSIRKPF